MRATLWAARSAIFSTPRWGSDTVQTEKLVRLYTLLATAVLAAVTIVGGAAIAAARAAANLPQV